MHVAGNSPIESDSINCKELEMGYCWGGKALPHVCCAIMMTKEADVA